MERRLMIGVIDIGSNSVRLLLRDGTKTLIKENIITQLALGMLDGVIDTDAIRRTANAVVFFVNKAKGKGANSIFIFATEALRKASNKNDFTSLVKKETDLTVEIVSGEEEAELGLLGALNGKDGAILDIGGGSTEITVSKKGKIEYVKSLDVGVVKLDNICGQAEEKLTAYCEKRVVEYKNVPKVKLTGVGGTITSVAAMLLSLKEYDATKVTGYVLKKEEIKKLLKKISKLSITEREKIIGLQPKRAKTILGGIIWLLKVMDYLKIDEITASDNDNLEGYLIKKGLYE